MRGTEAGTVQDAPAGDGEIALHPAHVPRQGLRLDADARDRTHRPFSLAWLIGSLLQVLVVGLIVLAALDCIFQTPRFEVQVLVKLGFAMALQLITLTAFILGRED